MVKQNYIAIITTNPAEISEAIRLRYYLYKNREEPETVKQAPPKKRNSKNAKPRTRRISYGDGFDKHSSHIIVKDTQNDIIVASLRVMDAFAAFELGGFFSEAEFDLGRVLNSAYLAEISQVAFHPEHQNREVFHALWDKTNEHCREKRIDRAILNLAIPTSDKTQEVRQVVNHTTSKKYTDQQFKVTPYQSLPSMDVVKLHSEAQFVLSSCLENGAKVCGEAFWNKELRTADLILQVYGFNKEEKHLTQNVA